MSGQESADAARGDSNSLLFGPFKATPTDVVLTCTIPGEPCSKARNRWNLKRGVTYTPDKTRIREQGIAAVAIRQRREVAADLTGLFSLRVGFYLGTNQARDVDNMLKLVSDGLKGVIWGDDRQVVEVFAFKVPDSEPRTVIVVARLPGMMPYTFSQCVICQRHFRTYPSWKYRTACSQRCWALSIRRRTRMICTQCGISYEVKAHRARAARFCSRACWADARRRPNA